MRVIEVLGTESETLRGRKQLEVKVWIRKRKFSCKRVIEKRRGTLL